MDAALSLTGAQHEQLRAHLLPGDGCEAVAVLLCGRHAGTDRTRLLARSVHPVPYAACVRRRPDRVQWPTEVLVPWLEVASKEGLSVVKVHSHPGGGAKFSGHDDAADRTLFPCLAGWFDGDLPHASAIMLPGGEMLGRTVDAKGCFGRLARVAVVGDDLHIWDHAAAASDEVLPEFMLRHGQAFGRGTTALLRRLSVAVVGCSGTGSPVVEMLARLGVGRLVLVDPDLVEEKNLNRILNATLSDAREGRFKVDVLARAIAAIDLGTTVETWPVSLFDPRVAHAVAGCDVVMGCTDSVEARWLLNRLATYYVLPYIDVGVRLEADGRGSISQACGTVHYLQPGRSSLLSRGLVDMERLRAEGTKRRNPAAYEEQRKEGYIANIDEDRPAVISVNMQLAAMAVNELLARLHPYRDDPNADYASTTASISQVAFYAEPEGKPCRLLVPHVGRGDVRPLLDDLDLGEPPR